MKNVGSQLLRVEVRVDSKESGLLIKIIDNAKVIREKLSDLERANRGRVHFRPTSSGITMVGLRPDRPQRGKGKLSANTLLKSFDEKYQRYCVDVPQGRETPEKELQSFLIADAYRHHRTLKSLAHASGCSDCFADVRFVTDEFSAILDNKKIVCDLLAVRSFESICCPVLIELKSSRDMTRLVEQIEDFTVALDQYRPQFEELFSEVLGKKLSLVGKPDHWIVWPPVESRNGELYRDDRETEMLKKGIGIVQYNRTGDEQFNFHVGTPPGPVTQP